MARSQAIPITSECLRVGARRQRFWRSILQLFSVHSYLIIHGQTANQCNAELQVSQGHNSLAPEREIPNQSSAIEKANAIGKDTLVLSETRDVSTSQHKYWYTHIDKQQISSHKQKITQGVAPKFHFDSEMEAARVSWLPKENGPRVACNEPWMAHSLKVKWALDGASRIFPSRASQDDTHKNTNYK